MIFGLSLHAFTQAHVLISLIGILAGLVFFGGVIAGRWLSLPNGVFLIFTILTSATGFLFPIHGPTPALVFGVLSLILLAVALYALYAKALGGGWKRVYLATALIAQWLNMVVLVVQSYQKVPALHALAPDGGGPAILATQGLVFVVVAYAGWRTLRRAG